MGERDGWGEIWKWEEDFWVIFVFGFNGFLIKFLMKKR